MCEGGENEAGIAVASRVVGKSFNEVIAVLMFASTHHELNE